MLLPQQTLQQLGSLRLHAMAEALKLQLNNPSLQALAFEERLAMLVQVEVEQRESRRVGKLVKNAKFKVAASAEDIDFRASRGLDRGQITSLLTCDWIRQHQNLIVTGPTGLGKTWITCALGHRATRQGMAVLYRRLPRLLEELEIAREDGSLPVLRMQLAKARLLILDDWGLAPMTPRGRQDLMEVVDDRVGTSSIAITAQMPVSEWHTYLGEPTIADAILDRLVHSAHRLALKGESLRKTKGRTGD